MRTMLLTESVDSDAQHRASIFDRGKTNCIPIYFVGRGLKAESRRSLASVYFLQETSWIDNKRLRLLSIQPLNARKLMLDEVHYDLRASHTSS